MKTTKENKGDIVNRKRNDGLKRIMQLNFNEGRLEALKDVKKMIDFINKDVCWDNECKYCIGMNLAFEKILREIARMEKK